MCFVRRLVKLARLISLARAIFMGLRLSTDKLTSCSSCLGMGTTSRAWHAKRWPAHKFGSITPLVWSMTFVETYTTIKLQVGKHRYFPSHGRKIGDSENLHCNVIHMLDIFLAAEKPEGCFPKHEASDVYVWRGKKSLLAQNNRK